MTRHYVAVLLLVPTLFTLGGLAQSSRRQRPTSNSTQRAVTDIRQVDFRNFTYRSILCAQEISGGIGQTVRVRQGKFKTRDAYFELSGQIEHGDLTGDGGDEAVIDAACGDSRSASSFYLSEIFIYTLRNGRPALLATLDDNQMSRDYARYYPSPNGQLWRLMSIKISNGELLIERLADGSMSMPEYIATLEYSWNGARLTLNGRPRKRPFRN